MPAIVNAFRRGGTYSWRRRIPARLARSCRIPQLIVALGTRDPARARFLAGQLTAYSDRLFRSAMSETPSELVMDRRQLDEVFREALLAHLAKLDRVAAAERSEPGFDPESSRRADRRMGWVLRLLGARGNAACLDETTVARMRADGLDDVDIAEAGIALGRMIRQNGHRMPRERLEAMLERQGAPATGVNLALVQETAFRAMAAAAFATDRRYDGHRPDDARRLEAIVLAEAGDAGVRREGWTSPVRDAAPEDVPTRPTHGCVDRSPAPSGAEDGTPGTPRPRAPVPLDRHPVLVLGRQLAAQRVRDGNWDPKTEHQACQIYGLFAKLLNERSLTEVRDLRQCHLADLVGLLREVSPSYGKSPKDEGRSTAELRAAGAALPTAKRGIAGPTINRHLTFIGQLITYLKAQGLPVHADLGVHSLRSKTTQRARTKRASLTEVEVEAIFRLPCFTGCRSWREPLAPGPDLFHRALYFGIMLLYYTGARREEICGLQVEDVGEVDGIPYLAIRPNSARRLKNDQSNRFVALHPELVRLGFLTYVEALRTLGYPLVFPELHSPGSRTPMGDRLYDQFIDGLKAAIPDAQARKKVLHSFRHALGNNLKQAGVHTEIRADILGHGGKSDTDERYCDPIALKSMLDELLKLPIVTAALEPRPVRLLPWVAEQATSPAPRRGRVGRAATSPNDRPPPPRRRRVPS